LDACNRRFMVIQPEEKRQTQMLLVS